MEFGYGLTLDWSGAQYLGPTNRLLEDAVMVFDHAISARQWVHDRVNGVVEQPLHSARVVRWRAQ